MLPKITCSLRAREPCRTRSSPAGQPNCCSVYYTLLILFLRVNSKLKEKHTDAFLPQPIQQLGEQLIPHRQQIFFNSSLPSILLLFWGTQINGCLHRGRKAFIWEEAAFWNTPYCLHCCPRPLSKVQAQLSLHMRGMLTIWQKHWEVGHFQHPADSTQQVVRLGFLH